MYKLNIFDKISFIICLLGGLNYGIVAITNLNLLYLLSFGSYLWLKVIYLIIFLCSINLILLLNKCNFKKS